MHGGTCTAARGRAWRCADKLCGGASRCGGEWQHARRHMAGHGGVQRSCAGAQSRAEAGQGVQDNKTHPQTTDVL
eukprot:127049-Chlamydomonas_euryale.AAC.1